MEEIEKQSTEKTERDLLKEKADLLGITYAGNISTEKLRDLVNKANDPEESETEQTDKQSTKLSNVDVVNDFRLEMTKRVRVLITCNDPMMKDYDMTPYYSFSNSALTLPAITVPLGVEWHIPHAYVLMLQDMECKIPVKSKDSKGRVITIRRTIKKYNVSILPPLTEKELEELKQAQIMRDGLK